MSLIHFPGNIETSLSWRQGIITAAVITFNSVHPWLRGLKEEENHPGFFGVRGEEKSLFRNRAKENSIKGGAIEVNDDVADRGHLHHNNSKKNRLSQYANQKSLRNRSVEISISSPNRLKIIASILDNLADMSSSSSSSSFSSSSLPSPVRQCEFLLSPSDLSVYCTKLGSFSKDKKDDLNRKESRDLRYREICDQSIHDLSNHWIEGMSA